MKIVDVKFVTSLVSFWTKIVDTDSLTLLFLYDHLGLKLWTEMY